jgi:ferredoxin
MEGIPIIMADSISENEVNTLRFYPGKCINCGMCSNVCPHGVFAPGVNKAELVRPEACMECGACQANCPTKAISVDSGVGCAAAMIKAALTGKEVSCGGDDGCCN